MQRKVCYKQQDMSSISDFLKLTITNVEVDNENLIFFVCSTSIVISFHNSNSKVSLNSLL